MDTITQSLQELAEARRHLSDVDVALANTNAYADGPRRDLKDAFAVIDQALDAQRVYWETAEREAQEQERAELDDGGSPTPEDQAMLDEAERNATPDAPMAEYGDPCPKCGNRPRMTADGMRREIKHGGGCPFYAVGPARPTENDRAEVMAELRTAEELDQAIAWVRSIREAPTAELEQLQRIHGGGGPEPEPTIHGAATAELHRRRMVQLEGVRQERMRRLAVDVAGIAAEQAQAIQEAVQSGGNVKESVATLQSQAKMLGDYVGLEAPGYYRMREGDHAEVTREAEGWLVRPMRGGVELGLATFPNSELMLRVMQ